MDFSEEIAALGRKSKQFGERFTKEQINEELTKNALIMPFIRALGYDIFDPMEVVPEFSAAIGEYKDARVDYAILSEGKPIIIFECKAYGTELDAKKCNQLMLYFHGTEAKVAILTDGNRYQFYSDLDEPNKMDSRPYMEFTLEKLDTSLLPELKKLAKGSFNVDDAMTSANILKYTKEFKRIMAAQLTQPDDDFLRFFLKRCYDGQVTQNVKDRFAPILKDALASFINDRINDRLQNALEQEQAKEKEEQVIIVDANDTKSEVEIVDNGIDTTDDEKQAYFIVKAILISAGFKADDIILKDYKGFCNICYKRVNDAFMRLWFNSKPYTVSFAEYPGRARKEKREQIEKLEELYQYKDHILQRIKDLEEGKTFEQ